MLVDENTGIGKDILGKGTISRSGSSRGQPRN